MTGEEERGGEGGGLGGGAGRRKPGSQGVGEEAAGRAEAKQEGRELRGDRRRKRRWGRNSRGAGGEEPGDGKWSPET